MADDPDANQQYAQKAQQSSEPEKAGKTSKPQPKTSGPLVSALARKPSPLRFEPSTLAFSANNDVLEGHITNATTETRTLDSWEVVGDADAFATEFVGLKSIPLEPGESIAFKVRFRSEASNLRRASLVVRSETANELARLELRGSHALAALVGDANMPGSSSRAEPSGRLGNMAPITIPEQVVGKTAQFTFAGPQNIDSGEATRVITLDGSHELSTNWMPTKVGANDAAAVQVLFAPTSRGTKRATLTVMFRWGDGHVESQRVQVTATARALEDVPAGSDVVRPLRGIPPPVLPSGEDRYQTIDETTGRETMSNGRIALFAKQQEGVKAISDESKKFQPKPADPSVWGDLADLAFQIGTGAIGGLAAKFIGGRVAKFFVDSEKALAAARAGEENIANAAKAAVEARGDAVEESIANAALVKAKVANYSNEGRAAHHAKIQSELGAQSGAIVARMMTMGAAGIRGARGPAAQLAPNQPTGKSAPSISKDGEIAFFGEQTLMLIDLEKVVGNAMASFVGELLKAHPDDGLCLLREITAGLEEAEAEATSLQASSTAKQFMAYLSQTENGRETVQTRSGSAVVTDMKSQRDSANSALEHGSLGPGVLQIDCERALDGSIKVVDARLKNVSTLIANRFMNIPLRQSGMAMRLSVNLGSVVATRDEAGRIRVSGSFIPSAVGEPDQIAEAERIFGVVFSKTLQEWGLPQVHTNDALELPDPKPTASPGKRPS